MPTHFRQVASSLPFRVNTGLARIPNSYLLSQEVQPAGQFPTTSMSIPVYRDDLAHVHVHVLLDLVYGASAHQYTRDRITWSVVSITTVNECCDGDLLPSRYFSCYTMQASSKML